MYLIDAHEDLAYNVLNFGRNYLRSAHETRQFEHDSRSAAPQHNGNTLLGWPDYQKARCGIIFATLFASPVRHRLGEWDNVFYRDDQEAHRIYQAQLDVYHRWADDHPDQFRLVRTRDEFETTLAPWQNVAPDEQPHSPVGLVILMEGAEGVRQVEELESWWDRGVRIIGPAWAGTRFCGGTREPGPLTKDGFALLEAMSYFGFTLDLSHMDEQAALQALDVYPGPIIASHANALALLRRSESNRHLSDRVIQGILERDGVIGVVPFNTFLKVGWKYGDNRAEVTLPDLVAHIDYICQLAGSAQHTGIGSDFDGGFGLESTPTGLDTIADLHKIAPLLNERGYSDSDIQGIMGGNWQRFLNHALPE